MEQIIINEGLIRQHIDAPELLPDAIAVTDFSGVIGSYVDEYNADWSLKKLSDRVALGRVAAPSGYKLSDDGTDFVAMSQVEKIAAEIEPMPAGYRLSDDKVSLVLKTTLERYQDKEITKNEAENILSSDIKLKRSALLYQCDWTQLPDVKLSDATKTKWEQYRQALRDITLQPGYPFTVVWPTAPTL